MSTTSYNAANNWLKKRVNVATTMDSYSLSIPGAFLPKARAQAFFSAKVAESRILDKLRSISDLHSSGKLGVGEARVQLKKFLWGNGYEKGGSKSMANLASTARLNLILQQNASMAAAVGRHQVSHDPDIMKIWPYYRYIAHDDARDNHSALDGTVLPKNDPFWSTYTPPWEFNCRCEVEDCDAEEAAEYGGINKVVTKPGEDGTVNATLDQNGHTVRLTPSPSGFKFNPAHAFEEFDFSAIHSPELRVVALDQMQMIYGQLLIETGENKYKLLPEPQKYKFYEAFGLDSAKKWTAIPVPAKITASAGMKQLKEGFTIKTIDGRKVDFNNKTIGHWFEPSKKGLYKPFNDIAGRITKLPMAVKTLTNPAEKWYQYRQDNYIQVFQKDSGGFISCMVTVQSDGQVRTYFETSVNRLDNKIRKGLNVKIFKKKKEPSN
ncbi:MAG: phage head morphogenesis protein [Victivallaceae bacterium]|nr:phage head morphogenesis protein [Victivallaceae bacterium]